MAARPLPIARMDTDCCTCCGACLPHERRSCTMLTHSCGSSSLDKNRCKAGSKEVKSWAALPLRVLEEVQMPDRARRKETGEK